jgi:hypothetical protein
MPHHAECWRENGRCTTFGCPGIDPATANVHPPLNSAYPSTNAQDSAPVAQYYYANRSQRSHSASYIIPILMVCLLVLVLLLRLPRVAILPPDDSTAPPSSTDNSPLPDNQLAIGEVNWCQSVITHEKQMNDGFYQFVSALRELDAEDDASLERILASCAELRTIAEDLPPDPPDAAYSSGYAEYCEGCTLIAPGTQELEDKNSQWADDINSGHQQYHDGFLTMINIMKVRLRQ